MHIIFGNAVKEIPNSFTVLELDTFKLIDQDQVDTAYCVVEKIPLTEFATLESYKTLHSELIQYYQQQQWNFCEQAIEKLMGRWNGELDTFYTALYQRIQTLKNSKLDAKWNGVIEK
jgi:hypothetical protein